MWHSFALDLMNKLIVLDRDGVINEDSDDYIKSPAEFVPVQGSLEAIGRLNKADYTVVVATNQSGIARGYYSEQVLAEMHEKLRVLLKATGGKIDRIYFCPHGPSDDCNCRKPKPGMLQQILQDYPVKPGDIYAIGDSLRDLQAAKAVGMIPVLVRTGKGMQTLEKLKVDNQFDDLPVYDDLQQAVDNILKT